MTPDEQSHWTQDSYGPERASNDNKRYKDTQSVNLACRCVKMKALINAENSTRF